jgi:hypothetical protein
MLVVPLICSVRFGTPITLLAGEDKTAFLARARDALLALVPAHRRAAPDPLPAVS